MSYLVLARKWRPKRFAELVGQQHVVRALSHALETGRVHHAFLFTGTRGVGKTTIARIFAKSLNCESGTSKDPCGVCGTCTDIDNGRYPDLIEIDAASHTGVDDVRALIDNAQYMPSRGRTKVYLIDEVHMLSKNAFNALLKTLEEPPEHVKFLLATTDPEKLPVTVLSRCLQFNLRRLEPEQISGQMEHILAAEGIGFDAESLALLADAADGSLRDGLSLLDQAIAYTGGSLQAELVQSMLGTVDRSQIEQVLSALTARDGEALMAAIEQLASFAPDFEQVLDRLAQALHEIQLAQLVPTYRPSLQRVSVKTFAQQLDAQLVQLWYQMAVMGRRDLHFAPGARVGFEMALLRMLAFVPAGVDAPDPVTRPAPPVQKAPAPPSVAAPRHEAAAPQAESPPPAAAATAAPAALPDTPEQWLQLLARLSLKGPLGQIGAHTGFVARNGTQLRLSYPADLYDSLSQGLCERFENALGEAFGSPVQLKFEKLAEAGVQTLHGRQTETKLNRQNEAEAEFQNHPVVNALLAEGAQIIPDSIRPLELK
ncbi:DNA polymerase III subunit gamma/tau [Arenimonas sp. GDDSR-1]|uniref:DNA polymerase III subunit gamma/tau n=1 Tax=Arenimonas sp. GDDSR-1 TaxID=2950125 RepID=UPI002617BBDB|nr:DNA polymerase III subunit gamma/tau [Arenimonas sp. GDDSR-1]